MLEEMYKRKMALLDWEDTPLKNLLMLIEQGVSGTTMEDLL